MEVLSGISPWWWVAGAVALAGMEMLTVSTVLIWSALAAMTVALMLWLAPDASGAAQLGLFALLSIGYTFLGRALVGRFGDGEGRSARLNQRAEALIGRDAEVVSFRFHEGEVRIDGVQWPARLEGEKTPEVGEMVRVIAADGIVVWVRRQPQPRAAEATEEA